MLELGNSKQTEVRISGSGVLRTECTTIQAIGDDIGPNKVKTRNYFFAACLCHHQRGPLPATIGWPLAVHSLPLLSVVLFLRVGEVEKVCVVVSVQR